MMISGDREGDHQQHDRHRRRVAHVEEAKALLVEQQRVEHRRALGVAEAVGGVRRVAGAAADDAARHVGLREVLQRLDHADDHGEQEHRAHRRQRDPAQPLQRAGAVELGRLVEVARNVEQRGEEDDHRVADAPEPEQHERRLRPRRRLEPQRAGDAEPAQHRVHRAGRRVEDVGEAERRRHRRRERRQVEDRAEEADAGLARARPCPPRRRRR